MDIESESEYQVPVPSFRLVDTVNGKEVKFQWGAYLVHITDLVPYRNLSIGPTGVNLTPKQGAQPVRHWIDLRYLNVGMVLYCVQIGNNPPTQDFMIYWDMWEE